MDFALIKEKEKLISQRGELVKQKIDISNRIKEVKVSENNAWKYNRGTLSNDIIQSIGEDKFITRKQLSTEILALDKQLSLLNNRLQEINTIEYKEKNKGTILKEILRDVFSEQQMNIIFEELNNRELGLPPTKISIGIDNSVNHKQLTGQYRKLAKSSIDSLISVRKKITSVIDDGCNRFDKGYFLQCISPLNREIPTLSELDKLKRNNHLN